MDPTELSSSMLAALLLLAVSLLRILGLPAPTSRQILDTLGVAHATAYARRRTLVEDLLRLDRGQGRPRKRREPPPVVYDTSPVSLAVLEFLMDHPGAVSGSPERRTYTIRFKRRVLSLVEAHPELSVAAVARATGVPEETLRAWLRGPPPSKEQEPPVSEGLDLPGLNLLVRAHPAWEGPLQPFCVHVREHLGLPSPTASSASSSSPRTSAAPAASTSPTATRNRSAGWWRPSSRALSGWWTARSSR